MPHDSWSECSVDALCIISLFILRLYVVRSLADVDNNGSLSVDEFCVAMHLVEMTKLGQTLPAVLPLDLVPPAYRTSISRSPLLTTSKMATSETLPPVNMPGFNIV